MAVGALLLVSALVFFAPFFFEGEHEVPFHFAWGSVTGIPQGGDPTAVTWGFPREDPSAILIHYPNACFVGESLRRGELPRWDPYVGCGAPGMEGGQVYPFSPFLWPFYLMPTPRVYTLGLLLGSMWGLLGAYLFLGCLGFREWQRWFGAVLWVFNPFTVRWVVYTNVWAGWWFGWLLWAWHGTLEPKGRTWWLPAVMIAGMVYCGHPETVFLLVGASTVYAAAAWAALPKERRAAPASLARRFVGVAALAAGLTAVHWLPLATYLARAYTYKSVVAESTLAHRYGLDSFLSPSSDVYLSPLLFGLLILAVPALRKERKLVPFLVLLALSLVLAHFVFTWTAVLKVVSLGGLFKSIYARLLFWYALAPLAAAGAGRLAEAVSPRRTSRALLLAAGVLPLGGFLLVNALGGGGVYRLLTPGYLLFYGTLFALGLAGALLFEGWGRGAVLGLLLAAVCLDPFMALGSSYRYFNRLDPGAVPAVATEKGKLEAVHQRMYAPTDQALWPTPFLSCNLAAVWGVHDVRAVDALLSSRMVALHDALCTAYTRDSYGTYLSFYGASPRALGLLGVGSVAVPQDRNSGRFSWQPVEAALPRAIIVHEVRASGSEGESLALWKSPDADDALRHRAILEGWTGSGTAGSPQPEDRVHWLEDGTDRVRLKATAPSGGVLVLLDTYASGWRATVDGLPAKIYPANLAFRAVQIPPGTHEVDFRYAPRSVAWGLALSGAGWLLVAALALRGRAKGRRGRSPSGGGAPRAAVGGQG